MYALIIYQVGNPVGFPNKVRMNLVYFPLVIVRRLLLCSSGKNIKVFSTISGDCVHELIGHDDMVTSIALFPGNPHQVSGY